MSPSVATSVRRSSLISVALAYPIGRIVDRYGGRRVIVVYWVMLMGMFAMLMHVHDIHGLLRLSIFQCCASPLYAAADMMVYKSAPPEHVGSITSTNSFLRNMIGGMMMFASGQLITHLGYSAAFTLGACVSTFGLAMFFVHRRAMGSEAAILGPLHAP